MGDARAIRIPADVRQAVAEWAGMGFAVTVDMRAGTISVTPTGPQPAGDPFDQVDMRR